MGEKSIWRFPRNEFVFLGLSRGTWKNGNWFFERSFTSPARASRHPVWLRCLGTIVFYNSRRYARQFMISFVIIRLICARSTGCDCAFGCVIWFGYCVWLFCSIWLRVDNRSENLNKCCFGLKVWLFNHCFNSLPCCWQLKSLSKDSVPGLHCLHLPEEGSCSRIRIADYRYSICRDTAVHPWRTG